MKIAQNIFSASIGFSIQQDGYLTDPLPVDQKLVSHDPSGQRCRKIIKST